MKHLTTKKYICNGDTFKRALVQDFIDINGWDKILSISNQENTIELSLREFWGSDNISDKTHTKTKNR